MENYLYVVYKWKWSMIFREVCALFSLFCLVTKQQRVAVGDSGLLINPGCVDYWI